MTLHVYPSYGMVMQHSRPLRLVYSALLLWTLDSAPPFTLVQELQRSWTALPEMVPVLRH